MVSLLNANSTSKTARFQNLAICVTFADFQAFVELWPNSDTRLSNVFLHSETIRIDSTFERAQVTR